MVRLSIAIIQDLIYIVTKFVKTYLFYRSVKYLNFQLRYFNISQLTCLASWSTYTSNKLSRSNHPSLSEQRWHNPTNMGYFRLKSKTFKIIYFLSHVSYNSMALLYLKWLSAANHKERYRIMFLYSHFTVVSTQELMKC